jgi:hypothetical protein
VQKGRVEKAPAEPSWQTNYYAMKEMLDAKLQDLKGENETSAQVKLRVDKFKEWTKATFIGKRVEWQGIVNDVRLGGRVGNRKVRVDFALLGIDGVAKDAFKNIDTTLRSDEIADVSRGAAARLCTIIAGIGVKAEKGKLVATIQTRKRLVEIDKGAKSKSRLRFQCSARAVQAASWALRARQRLFVRFIRIAKASTRPERVRA